MATNTLTARFPAGAVPVVFTSNDDFAVFLGVAIRSLLEHSSTDSRYEIFILHRDLTAPSREKLASLATDRPHVALRFVDMSPHLGGVRESVFHLDGYVPVETYFKFFLPSVLPGYDKCVCLDSDIVLLDDVASLFRVDLGGKAVGASPNVAVVSAYLSTPDELANDRWTWRDYLHHCLKLENPGEYFQAGVLVCDLARLRAMDFTARCLALLEEIRTPRYFDQCVLNRLLQGNVCFLSTAWNHVWYFRDPVSLKGKIGKALYDDYARTRRDPKIVHYAGETKAYHDPRRELADHFWRYARLCPFYGEILRDSAVHRCRRADEVDASPSARPGSSRPEFRSVAQFRDIPLADESGIVLDSKLIRIVDRDDLYQEGWDAFGNASIVKAARDGYRLAFRRDVISWPYQMRMSWIGTAEFDASFEQRSEVTYVQTGHRRPEDPRLFRCGEKLYLLYDYLLARGGKKCSRMELALLDETMQIARKTELPFALQAEEKNWTPFVHADGGEARLHFIYSFNPWRVLAWTGAEEIEQLTAAASHSARLYAVWERRWGEIRGGTPALRIGDEYLCFFHSHIVTGRRLWYVFGAIAFDRRPPFHLRRISPHPILFRDCYSSPVKPQAFFYTTMEKKDYRVMFPCGFAEGVSGGRPALFLTCGENESAVRLVVFDSEALLDSLVDVDRPSSGNRTRRSSGSAGAG